MDVTVASLFERIGRLQVENDALRAENDQLRGQLVRASASPEPTAEAPASTG